MVTFLLGCRGYPRVSPREIHGWISEAGLLVARAAGSREAVQPPLAAELGEAVDGERTVWPKPFFLFLNGPKVELERKEWHVQGDICPWIYGYTLSPWNLWTCLKFFQSNSELMVDLCRFWYVGSISKVEMLLSITAGGHIQWLMCQPLTTPGSGWDGVCLLAMVLFSWMVSHCCVLLGFLQDKNLFLGITSCVGCQLWYDQGSGPICPPYLHDFLTTLYIVAGLSLYSLRAPPKKVTKTCWSSEIIQIVGVSFILYIYI